MLEECHAVLPDFTSYFAFSRKRSGYSGVATYCAANATPYDAKEGIAGSLSAFDAASQSRIEEEFSAEELKELDAEGRAVVTWHRAEEGAKSVAVINVYCPRADPERRDRRLYKLRFYKLLEMRADALLGAGHSVVIVGDVNTSHKQIDHCDPYEVRRGRTSEIVVQWTHWTGNLFHLFIRHLFNTLQKFESQPGRQWLDHFLHVPGLDAPASNEVQKKDKNDDDDDDDDSSEWKATAVQLPGAQFVDAFRQRHPDRKEAFTCWNTKLNCRANNYGTRIDYVFVDRTLAAESLSECEIHPDVEDSDHCPVSAELTLRLVPSEKSPQNCTKNFPEFSGRQQKLSQFFAKRTPVAGDGSAAQPPPAKKPREAKQQTTMRNFFQSKAAKAVASETVAVAGESRRREVEVTGEHLERRVATASAWKSLFKGPPPAPNCRWVHLISIW